VAQLYPRALGSLYVVSYNSQGYGGFILTPPSGTEWSGPKSKVKSHVMTDGRSISTLQLVDLYRHGISLRVESVPKMISKAQRSGLGEESKTSSMPRLTQKALGRSF
jgi:hypothetical protein